MDPKENTNKLQVRLKSFISGLLHNASSVKHAVFIISIFIGVITGLIAVLLKTSVGQVHHFISQHISTNNFHFLYLTPLVGILLVQLYIRYWQKGKEYKGLSDIIHGVAKSNIRIPFTRTYSHLITSTLTVGMGGSVGLEAPIAATGAAIGSNIARGMKFDMRIQSLFLACGTAGGIAAIFNCPVAGVIFAVEVLFGELTISNVVPIIICSATAAIVSKALYGGQLFIIITEGWRFEALPFYGLLGLVCGSYSAVVIKSVVKLERWFRSYKSKIKRYLLGGLPLVALIILFFPLYGEGYSSIEALIRKDFDSFLRNSNFLPPLGREYLMLYAVALILILKIPAVSFTTGSGGDGGIIAPSLFMGALLGFLTTHALHLTGLIELNATNFIAVGMAGVISGIIRAPLTAIFLIAEITGSYTLFIPLMIVSSISFFTSKYFEPHSVYTKPLNEEGLGDPGNRDENIISRISFNDILEKDFSVVSAELTLKDFIGVILQSRRNIFPVLNTQGGLEGIVYLDEIREYLLNEELYDVVLVNDIMRRPAYVISDKDNIQEIFNMFYKSSLWNIPVLEDNKYRGFVSKSKIFEHYRTALLKDIKPIV